MEENKRTRIELVNFNAMATLGWRCTLCSVVVVESFQNICDEEAKLFTKSNNRLNKLKQYYFMSAQRFFPVLKLTAILIVWGVGGATVNGYFAQIDFNLSL